jgi:hypothetical protein
MNTSTDTVDLLTDRQANTAAHFAIREWISHSGPEALLIWQRLDKLRADVDPLERWIIDPSADEQKAAVISRKILKTFLDVGQFRNADFSRWAREGIKLATEPGAQIFDPVSAGILGTLAIGLVLAARVKKIGSTEFYEGLPPGLEKIIRSVIGSLGI